MKNVYLFITSHIDDGITSSADDVTPGYLFRKDRISAVFCIKPLSELFRRRYIDDYILASRDTARRFLEKNHEKVFRNTGFYFQFSGEGGEMLSSGEVEAFYEAIEPGRYFDDYNEGTDTLAPLFKVKGTTIYGYPSPGDAVGLKTKGDFLSNLISSISDDLGGFEDSRLIMVIHGRDVGLDYKEHLCTRNDILKFYNINPSAIQLLDSVEFKLFVFQHSGSGIQTLLNNFDWSTVSDLTEVEKRISGYLRLIEQEVSRTLVKNFLHMLAREVPDADNLPEVPVAAGISDEKRNMAAVIIRQMSLVPHEQSDKYAEYLAELRDILLTD